MYKTLSKKKVSKIEEYKLDFLCLEMNTRSSLYKRENMARKGKNHGSESLSNRLDLSNYERN